jgi:hypothetical protein
MSDHRHTASLRRGIMHAVERIDLLFPSGKPIPKSRAQEKLSELRALADELAEFARHLQADTYAEGFDLCQRDYYAAAARLGFDWAKRWNERREKQPTNERQNSLNH